MDDPELCKIPTNSPGHKQPTLPILHESTAVRNEPFSHPNGEPLEDEDDSGNDSSEGDDTDPEDTASVIGISISKAQSRLKSPTTPAAEKAAALERSGGFFFGEIGDADLRPQTCALKSRQTSSPLDIASHSTQRTTVGDDVGGRDVVQSRASPPPVLPSPWRAGPKLFEKLDESRPSDVSAKNTFRERSASIGPERWMRIPLSFPSFPKGPWSFGASTHDDGLNKNKQATTDNQRRSSPHPDLPQNDGPSWTRESFTNLISRSRAKPEALDPPINIDPSLTTSESTSQKPKREITASPRTSELPGTGLRRSTSDQSLYLSRQLSQTPSLGDDSRFENVHEMMNNRFKAVKDSFQDSNFRLTLPKAPALFSSKADVSNGESSSNSWVRRSLLMPNKDSSSGNLSSSPDRADERTSGKAPKVAGMSATTAATHPQFAEALENLTGDIVVLGGYRGSVLREAQAPNRRLWVPLKVGFNLRKVDLEVGFEDEDEDKAHEKIIPDGMLTHIGPVDISKRLFKRLRASENAQNGLLRVHDYGYDWRLNPDKLSRGLVTFLKTLPCNASDIPLEKRGATVIAHSLGGLIVRHAVNEQPDLFAGVVYAGVPESCVNILGPLRHGDDVLFSSKVLTAQVNFSIRTSFAMLPLHGRCFLDKDTKEEYPIDFFNVDDWVKYRLSPCVEISLPPLPDSVPKKPSIMGSVSSMIPESLSNALPSMPFYKKDSSSVKDTKDVASSQQKSQQAASHAEGHFPGAGMAPQMGSGGDNSSTTPNTSTATSSTKPTPQQLLKITIPRSQALAYLSRTLPRVKLFREQLAHNPAHQAANSYPPLAVIYGKSEPTVYGARVHGRDGIARSNAYDDLAFASGDGVVLARLAMLPEGYIAARGGVVETGRGHVTLLGDLEAVGRCLEAVRKARAAGVGTGERGGQRETRRREREGEEEKTPHAPELEG